MANKDFQNGLIVALASGVTIAEGGNIGYQVKFKVDGEDYYIASCQQGESITVPPIPTMQSGSFAGWQDSNGNVIAFPYTPNADITLEAKVSYVDFLASNDENIAILNGYSYYVRNLSSGNGFEGDKDLVGYFYGSDGKTSVVLITKVARNNAFSKYENPWNEPKENANTAITYNGETYYYGASDLNSTAGNFTDTSEFNRYKCTDGLTAEQAATELLNAYFGN
jgi:hypothetical protein